MSSESVWISQAEAARIRGVSREAIRKLVAKDRFRTLSIGGRKLIHREDVLSHTNFDEQDSTAELEHIKRLILQLDESTQRKVFEWLRHKFPIHEIESDFGVNAEVILEAIHRSPDLSKRGIRGLITEASFKVDVLDLIAELEDITPEGNHSYDFAVRYRAAEAKIQVKMQRKKSHRPMAANEAYRRFDPNYFVVETQRTRAGKIAGSQASTRPYRFDEFDILAVSMEPSTKNWCDFRFTLSRWLLPDPKNPSCMLKFQPVAARADDDWTDNLLECLQWLRSDIQKTIRGSNL